MTIVERICANPMNKTSLGHLQEFTDTLAKQGRPVEITYLPGNHDWLVNRYPETRRAVAAFLGLRNPIQYQKKAFPTENYWESYRVFARHANMAARAREDGVRFRQLRVSEPARDDFYRVLSWRGERGLPV